MEENMIRDSVIAENVQEIVPNNADMVKEMKKTAAKIGWKYALFGLVVTILQIIYSLVLPQSWHGYSWAQFMQIILPMYVLGFPLILLLTSKMPVTKIEKKKMGFWKWVLCVLIGAGICGVGSIIGSAINMALTLPFGVNAEETNALANMMLDSNPFWRILTVGILAPIFEEFIFRKLLIDRVVKYGEFLAIMLSGLMFGMFHGNFAQVFFATGLGLFWAFIYVKTGKVWYTIALHMTINLTTSVINLYFVQKYFENMEILLDPNAMYDAMAGDPAAIEALIVMMAFLLWMGFLGLLAFTGIILFFVFLKKFRLNPNPYGISNGCQFGKGVFSWGVILFWCFCIFLFVQYYGSMILMAIM